MESPSNRDQPPPDAGDPGESDSSGKRNPEPEPEGLTVPLSPYEVKAAEKPAEIPQTNHRSQLRLATSAMVQRGIPLAEAAKEFKVDPDLLFIWHRTYVKFVGKGVVALSANSSPDRIEIDAETSKKFDQNWEEMLRQWELERPQLSPVRKWLISSPLTSWLFRGERVDKITVAGAFAALAFTALAIYAGTSHQGRAKNRPGGAQAPTEPPPLDLSDPESIRGDRQDEMLEMVVDALEQFAKLETWQERLPYIRNPEKTKPLMAAYYQDHPDGSHEGLVVEPQVSFIGRDEGMFVLIQGHLNQGAAAPKPLIFLAELTDGEPAVLFDWEVLVKYEPIPWEEFKAARSEQAAPFRVRIARGDYYNQPFMDSEEYACYALAFLHRDELIYGFVERKSELARRLEEKLFSELNANRAMILNLRYPEGTKFDNILQIDSIEADGWLGE